MNYAYSITSPHNMMLTSIWRPIAPTLDDYQIYHAGDMRSCGECPQPPTTGLMGITALLERRLRQRITVSGSRVSGELLGTI